jgi:hypothetical protein
MLPLIDEVVNIVTNHEMYTFLDGFSRYHQISIVTHPQTPCYTQLRIQR